jgi:DNA-binding CsgD family transcriptional regulator
VATVTNLSSSDLRDALAVAGTWHETTSLPELATTAVGTLHELVPCDGVGWNEVDLTGAGVRAVTSPAEYFEPEQVDTLTRLIDQHPIVSYVTRTGDQSATKISDFVSAREFHRLEIYADFFRPLGAEDLLAVVIQAEPVMIGLAFTRPARTYLERDRELLNLLRPHLASAYRNIRAKLEAQQRASALERGLDGREVVALTPNGRLATASPLLERWFGAIPPLLEPGVYERDDARLTVRRVEGDPPLLLLDERRFAPDPQRVRELGLTSREAAIVMLTARGLSDVQIADELFVSVRTVSKHLQHAYEKLGVHSRADAARVLLDR